MDVVHINEAANNQVNMYILQHDGSTDFLLAYNRGHKHDHDRYLSNLWVFKE